MSTQSFSALGDTELEALTRNGDLSAYAELWQRHARAGSAAARQFSSIADPDDIVSEAYLLILRALQRGGGPSEAFRPYLYSTIRNVALDWRPKAQSIPLEDAPEQENPAPDPETATIRSTITARAFRTLPERWQTVLWYTEVEGLEPAEAAPYLGMNANAVSALAYRAREGLKKSWLQAHVNERRIPEECRWTTQRMGDYSRGGLSPAAHARFEKHLENCTRCSILLEEIDDLGGRLAAVLLPVILGGSAAAGLIASQLDGQSGSANTANSAGASSVAGAGGAALSTGTGGTAGAASAASGTVARALARLPAPRVLLATAAIAVAAVTATVIVTTNTQAPQAPVAIATDEPTPPLPLPTEPPAGTPAPIAPPTTAPTSPPVNNEPPRAAIPAPQPVKPPAPAPQPTPTVPAVTPPAPSLSSPVSGALTNIPTPTFVGSGKAGASVDIGYYNGAALVPLASTAVLSDGSWSVASGIPIPDGTWQLEVTQTQSALRSPATSATLSIDTVALPPSIDPLPANPLVYLPELSGSAEPDATVEVRDNADVIVTNTSADSAGLWSVVLPDRDYTNATLTAAQTDLAGNHSLPSAATAMLDFTHATMTPADGATLTSTGGATVVTLQLSGINGYQVEVFVDGFSTGNMHTLQATPIARSTGALADGVHTFGVRYADGAGRVGPTTTHTVTIAP